jgi:hypothetical protein
MQHSINTLMTVYLFSLLVFFGFYKFIIFTFTYMCIHYLGHLPLPPIPPCCSPIMLKKNKDHKKIMVFFLVWDEDSYTERFLACFHACVHYNSYWFISTRPPHYFLVPFPQWSVPVYDCCICSYTVGTSATFKFQVSFPFPIPPVLNLPLGWFNTHEK